MECVEKREKVDEMRFLVDEVESIAPGGKVSSLEYTSKKSQSDERLGLFSATEIDGSECIIARWRAFD